jgi:hypothetical protein
MEMETKVRLFHFEQKYCDENILEEAMTIQRDLIFLQELVDRMGESKLFSYKVELSQNSLTSGLLARFSGLVFKDDIDSLRAIISVIMVSKEIISRVMYESYPKHERTEMLEDLVEISNICHEHFDVSIIDNPSSFINCSLGIESFTYEMGLLRLKLHEDKKEKNNEER